MRTALLAMTILLAAAGAGRAGEGVSVAARLEPDRTRIGDPVRFILEVASPREMEIIFGDLAAALDEDWEVVESEIEIEETATEKVTRRRYSLLAFRAGDIEISAPPVRGSLPDGSEIEVSPPSLALAVESLLDPLGDGEIRDIKPPLAFGTPILGPAAAAVVVLVLAGAAVYLLRRRHAPESETPPPRPAEEVALEALEEIRRKNLPGRGLVKEYYLEVSNVVRRYLENRFGLRAPERTTEEFLQELTGDGSLSRPHQELLAAFLTHCDLVKFARYGPTADEIEEVYRSARRLVLETGREAKETENEVWEMRQGT